MNVVFRLWRPPQGTINSLTLPSQQFGTNTFYEKRPVRFTLGGNVLHMWSLIQALKQISRSRKVLKEIQFEHLPCNFCSQFNGVEKHDICER